MNNCKILDCTLRDGGYINNWAFGKNAIADIKDKLEQSEVEIIEIGFMKNEPYNEDRAVFNSMEQAKKIMGKKQAGKQYAVMVEVSNPLPLDMLETASEDGVDIVRIVIWKSKLKEGFEYCKAIAEKGYKICVQPARVSQYSDTEFVDMVKMFNEINPLAVYVVDSWGTMYKDELLHYLKLADENLKPEISVGYHGHNNMMQAFEVACVFVEQNLNRGLIIDASIYGIGRGAGNLNTELFAKYMNAKHNCSYKLQPITKIFDLYISEIHDKIKWGYSFPFMISAQYNCNPDFVTYYEKKNCSSTLMEKYISSLSIEELVIFKESIAKKILYSEENKKAYELDMAEMDKCEEEATRNTWSKKLGIIVITANRANVIKEHIEIMSKSLKKYDVDLIIYDSSGNDETRKVVEHYQQNGVDNLVYDFYDKPVDPKAIDIKVTNAYEKYAQKYEYVLGTRDRCTANIDDILPKIEDKILNDYDFIVINQYGYDHKSLGNTIYVDCQKLFQEQCHQMTILGATIFRSKTLLAVLKEAPSDPKKNYGMWQPLGLFEYIATHEFIGASLVSDVWTHITPSDKKMVSFWHKNIFWQFAERWYESINALPSIYDIHKKEVLKLELFEWKPFSPLMLLYLRQQGGLDFKDIAKYEQALPSISDTPLHTFYATAYLPRIFASQLIKHRRKWYVKTAVFVMSNAIFPIISLFDKSVRKRYSNTEETNVDTKHNPF